MLRLGRIMKLPIERMKSCLGGLSIILIGLIKLECIIINIDFSSGEVSGEPSSELSGELSGELSSELFGELSGELSNELSGVRNDFADAQE